jgi:hypothetical protein
MGESRHLEGWTRQICGWVAEWGDGRWGKVTDGRRVRNWDDLVFNEGMGHGRARPWPDCLGPFGGRSNLFERCRWADESVDPWELEPCHDWLPVGLWLGTPGLLTQVDVEALSSSFATFGCNAGVELTRIVWCRESAKKQSKQSGLPSVSVSLG